MLLELFWVFYIVVVDVFYDMVILRVIIFVRCIGDEGLGFCEGRG